MASINMKLKDLVEDPKTAAVLEKHIPGLTTSPELKIVYGMTLKAVAKYPQAKFSQEVIDKIEAELQAL